MITIPLDLNSAPMYEQIYLAFKGEIESQRLRYMDKLPSKRRLASHLGVSVNTVDSAYQQLSSEGYIESSPKRGYYVCEIDEIIHVKTAENVQIERVENEDYLIDFSPNDIAKEYFPLNTWKKLVKGCLAEGVMLETSESQGNEDLRLAISSYLLQSRGVDCSPDQIIVGAGTEYLLQVLALILNKEGTVAMENPVYNKAYRIFENMGYKVESVNIDEKGIPVSGLTNEDISYVYITPSHQFPLGISMPISRRIHLLNYINAKDEGYIIEDDYDSEFRYYGKPLPSLKSIDTKGKVIYIGTFSKSISPSIRISYMVLPQNLLALYEEKVSFMSCPVPRFDQKILADFMITGHFERHLSRMRKVYKHKREYLVKCLEVFGDKAEIMGENAGHHLLLKLDSGISEEEMVKAAQKNGVKVYGISRYFTGKVPKKYASTVLLGYAGIIDDQLNEGIGILKKAWNI